MCLSCNIILTCFFLAKQVVSGIGEVPLGLLLSGSMWHAKGRHGEAEEALMSGAWCQHGQDKALRLGLLRSAGILTEAGFILPVSSEMSGLSTLQQGRVFSGTERLCFPNTSSSLRW